MKSSTRNRIRSSLTRLGVNALVSLVSLVFVLLAAELLVRAVAPQQLTMIRPDIWQPDDSVGWEHRPQVETRVNTGERTVEVYTDRDGYRVGRRGSTKARTRILLLGDSFMEALQVRYENSLAGLLESQLTEMLGEQVAVRNAGVAGWGPNQYYLQARFAMRRSDFDLVLVTLFVEDDAVRQRFHRFPPRQPA